MITQKQIEAARINGAKSHGPVTPEGKQISSGNATRHGLLSGAIVLKGESIERFEALYDSLLAEHQPATQSEVAIVNARAAALWLRLVPPDRPPHSATSEGTGELPPSADS